MSVVYEEEQAAPPRQHGTAADEGDPHRYLIAFAVVLAALMQVIDSSIVNVALPDMMGNLGASLDEIAWVITGYILASVIVIPLTGLLGDLLRAQALLRRLHHPLHRRRASSAARRGRWAR